MDAVLTQWQEFFSKGIVPDHFLIVLSVILVTLAVANFFSSKANKKEQPPKDTKNEVVEKKVDHLSWEKRLFSGLSKTRSEVWGRVGALISGKKIDDDVLEELEEVLYTADMSPSLVAELLEELKENSSEINEQADHLEFIKSFMKSKMSSAQESVNKKLYQFEKSEDKLKVIMIVGVNGAGKTTTLAKLAQKIKNNKKKCVMAAGDTFRAAAIDQLQVWADRTGVPIVKQQMGSVPASVAFETVQEAVKQNADVVLVDTAGRLHNKVNLMNELSKVKRVMQKVADNVPDEVLLVLDGSTGQNAFEQAKQFTAATEVTSLAITKLDGTAKGGVVIGISDQFQIPVKYIGVGEGIEDLQVFNKFEFS